MSTSRSTYVHSSVVRSRCTSSSNPAASAGAKLEPRQEIEGLYEVAPVVQTPGDRILFSAPSALLNQPEGGVLRDAVLWLGS